jgi:hypothetical protein
LQTFPAGSPKNPRDNPLLYITSQQSFFGARQRSHSCSRNTATHKASQTTTFCGKLLARRIWRPGAEKLLIIRATLKNFGRQIHDVPIGLTADFTTLKPGTRPNRRSNTSPLTRLSSSTFSANNGSPCARPASNLPNSSCGAANTKRRKKLWDLLDHHRAKQTRVLEQGGCGSPCLRNETLALSFF